MNCRMLILTALLACLTDSAVHAKTIFVKSTIQAAVDAAQPGDTIRVPPGVYRENVVVNVDDLTITGSASAVLDGRGLLGTTGIRVTPAAPATMIHGFTLRGLTVRNYSRTGVFLSRVDHYEITNGRYFDNAVYAIFPVRCSDGLIEFNEVAGSEDSGIYVGVSSDVSVRKNHVYDNRVGIEIENSFRIDVDQNFAIDNSIGIFVFVLPLLSVTVTEDILVTDNVMHHNNRPIVRDPNDPLSQIPTGVGLLNTGADRVLIDSNVATHNDTAGIAIAQLPPELADLDPLIDPFPDDNLTIDNVAQQNGANSDILISPLPGSDLLWDFSGIGNVWLDNVFKTSFPDPLPD